VRVSVRVLYEQWCGALRKEYVQEKVSLIGRSRTVVGCSTHCSRGITLFGAASLVLQWIRGESS
jgi:hypothetical protein